MYDLIHGNTQDKTPIRFALFEEAKRILKPEGVLSIAPFECENLRDRNGKVRKYTHQKLIAEIEASGFLLAGSVDGAIHFDYYHNAYHWKKLNGDMSFDYLEKGPVLNFRNKKDCFC
jgi:ubiquinone/menaquinone biosynthesis C-methylase UbiE